MTSTTTHPGISDAGLLVIRIAISVVLVIGLLYGFLIMTTFRRYGVVMDKAWKQRIDRWIDEKGKGSFNPQYPSMSYASYPEGSTRYRQPRYKSSRYHRDQPSFSDDYSHRDTYSPAHPSDAYVPPPELHSTPTHSPRSQLSTDLNQSSKTQNDDNNTASAVYNPNPGTTTPSLPPKVSITSVEETPPRLIRKKPHFAVPPPPSLPPIPGTPTTPFSDQLSKGKDDKLGFSSVDDALMMIPKKPHLAVPSPLPIPGTLTTPLTDQSSKDKDDAVEFPSGRENKVGGDSDVPDDENRVRFQSSPISDQGIINNLVHRYMGVDVGVEVSGTSREPSDNGLSYYDCPDNDIEEKEEQERQPRQILSPQVNIE